MKRTLFYLATLSLLHAQSLEPRLYSNAPVGLNFLAAGYTYSQGSLPNNPEIELEAADMSIQAAFLAYVRVIELFGQSGKVNMAVPTVCIDGSGIYRDEPATRNVCGLGDVKGSISVNLWGAPALSLKEYGGYRQDLIVGASLQVTAPTGQYDHTKLVNIGANRWAFKPGFGISQALGDFVFELSGAAEFYTENDAFWGNNRRSQDPIYSTQAHVVYNFIQGLWGAVDANYYWGGESSVNGVRSDDTIGDSRYGFTLSLPVTREHSLKLYSNSGVFTRTGTDFNMFGAVWQYRFGGGF